MARVGFGALIVQRLVIGQGSGNVERHGDTRISDSGRRERERNRPPMEATAQSPALWAGMASRRRPL